MPSVERITNLRATVSPQRLARVPITLKDGTHIPKGSFIAWAGHHHGNDPAMTDHPEVFNPMRSYNKRQIAANRNRFTAAQPTHSNLSFGFGNQSCPGRFFALGEIKFILSRLLLEYDFKLPEGQTRPKTIHIEKIATIDPSAGILMRKRI